MNVIFISMFLTTKDAEHFILISVFSCEASKYFAHFFLVGFCYLVA